MNICCHSSCTRDVQNCTERFSSKVWPNSDSRFLIILNSDSIKISSPGVRTLRVSVPASHIEEYNAFFDETDCDSPVQLSKFYTKRWRSKLRSEFLKQFQLHRALGMIYVNEYLLRLERNLPFDKGRHYPQVECTEGSKYVDSTRLECTEEFLGKEILPVLVLHVGQALSPGIFLHSLGLMPSVLTS